MNQVECNNVVEALLFASDNPLGISRLQNITGATTTEIKNALDKLSREYDEQNRSFGIQEIAGGYQILSRTEYHSWISKLRATRDENKLSTAALETLSIIAYKQPVLRAEIESIRGVDSSAIIRALMEKGLVKIASRAETLGKPILYGTTNKFLEILGLVSIKDLPKPEEMK